MDMQISKIEEELTNITYNVLCSDRVTQMTKTYNDIEAVTRLLEEKERDLELAAKIGQTLLEKNKYFEEKNEELELLISQANERINQLKHDLSMKDELLKIYTQTYEGGDASSPDTPDSKTAPGLQKKIRSLEDENLQLHLETSKLKGLTEGLEEKEQQLVNDCVQQLEDVHNQLAQLSNELLEKSEECSSQKEEITNLLLQIVTLQKKVRTLTADNMDLQKTLEAAYDSQNYLTREIGDLKEKNEEILALLEETQEELRRFRSKERPSVMRHSYMSPMFNTTGESLASELENSMRSEVDYPKGYSSMERKKHTWKVFETAKAAKAHARNASGSSCATSMLGASLADNEDSRSVSQRSSMYFSDTESAVSENCAGDIESLYGATSTRLGRPGIPGSNDLQSALRRLSMRRANELNEMDYAREERERQEREQKFRERTVSEVSEKSDTESATPGRCRTPDSMFSANSGYMSMTGSSGNPYYKMPEKLRIVKPLEGSVTLRQWQRLATPHLGGIFESRPGVRMKGENVVNVNTEPEVYTLSDYEEDDEMVEYSNRFQESSGVYTLTDSCVRHPSEAGRTTSSYTSSTPKMAIGHVAENHGTSTFSMSLGLASILNERDIEHGSQQGVRSQHSVASSNPARFPSLISDTHFNIGQQSSPSTTLTLPTNSYRLIPSPSTLPQRLDRNVNSMGTGGWHGISGTLGSQGTEGSNSVNSLQGQQGSTATVTDAKNADSANSDSNRLGMINKLKNTGFSLYGYITGSVPANGTGLDTSRPNSLPLTSTAPSVTVAMATGSNSVTTVTDSTTVTTNSVDIDNMVTIGTSTAESPRKSHLASVLTRKTAGGVIGALAKWHRDGSL
ncbi:trafficking kinesin-binding protein 1-like isoform X3 [Mercenaria mercenaria]|uniref:trafficking kinesin-binding protein 1-like isoform X3 n=1 Tax=Mercenaria mercenaria TaxID=6596 RepID=UPI00234E5B1E|nr:trafficking kinesin-binding protein 1-like isoform X3 [Mercenaria mercenaria]